MRRVLVALLACGFVAQAHGEPARTAPPLVPPPSPLRSMPEASLSPLRLDDADLDRIERSARRRRNVGIGLGVPGVVLLVVGGVLIGAGAKDARNGERVAAAAGEIAAGSVSAGLGLVFTIPGALLWVGGQDSLDVAAWRRGHTGREHAR